MIPYIGDFAEDVTVYHYFNTFDANDPCNSVTITDLADTDIFVYKDGSVTDLVTDGASVVINFDSRTGLHKITIDTSAHADYAIGSDYMVMVNGTTVDGGTVTAGLFTFSIENRYNDVNVVTVSGTSQTANDNGADINAILADTNELQTDDVPGLISTLDAVVDTVKAETALIVADTNELQTDWADGGRLDLLLDGAASAGDPWTTTLPGAYGAGTAGKIIGDNIDAPISTVDANVDSILTDTGTTLPATLSTIDGKVDTIDTNVDQIEAAVITNAAGVDIAADIIAVKAETALIVADTNELQTDDIPAAISGLNDVAATDIVSAGAITTLAGAVVNVDLVDTTTTNTDMRGTDGANTTVPDAAGVAPTAIENRQEMDSNSVELAKIDELTTQGDTNETKIDAIKAETALIVADTNELQSDDLPGLIAALNDLSSSDVLTTALTESYAADGSEATLSQLLYQVWSVMNSLKFVSTTGTSRKLDGTTTAMTFTIDDATTPTDINRAT